VTQTLSLIGYGEAGRTFARAAGWEADARVFDIKPLAPLYKADAVSGCTSCRAAVTESPLIISLVTADQALAAAQSAAESITPGALYFDMNSVAPATKCAAANAIATAGGRYVDAAIMAPVDPARLAVPLLVSGPDAMEGAKALAALGFTNVRSIRGDIGQASAIKMIRSIMVKGQEALTAEMMLAAEQAGVADEVLASLGNDWAAKADYNLERMKTHGLRRAAEMEEVAKTILALGIEPIMTVGTVQRQREMAGQRAREIAE
jgi:3-hydroxyisobutyrate dehydrogenase-like beta-hydroxyacid dehydrogenase